MGNKKQNANIVYGIHSTKSLLQSRPEEITEIKISLKRHDKKVKDILTLANRVNVSILYVDRTELDTLTNQGVHQGVIAFTHNQAVPSASVQDLIESKKENKLVLVLDQIQDPHNLGACIRTADGAGVDAVILPKDNSCPINETVHKVSAGATQRVPVIRVTNLSRALATLKEGGFWVYGTSDSAKTEIYKTSLSGDVVLVMGSEGHGIRKLTAESCDHLVSIPMSGSVSSLNVSVATGVCLFEIIRQRNI